MLCIDVLSYFSLLMVHFKNTPEYTYIFFLSFAKSASRTVLLERTLNARVKRMSGVCTFLMMTWKCGSIHVYRCTTVPRVLTTKCEYDENVRCADSHPFFAEGSQRRAHWHKCNFTNMFILQHKSKKTYPMIDQNYCKCGVVEYVCMYIHVFASCVSF